MRKLFLGLGIVAGMLGLFSGTASAATGSFAVINDNQNGDGIGIVHFVDGNYGHPALNGGYDYLLPANHDSRTDTGWANTGGVYIGAGGHVCFFNSNNNFILRANGPQVWQLGNSAGTYLLRSDINC